MLEIFNKKESRKETSSLEVGMMGKQKMEHNSLTKTHCPMQNIRIQYDK